MKTSILVLISILVSVLAVERIEKASFNSPFKKFDEAGKRMVPEWRIGGDATLQENFLRLTPDRQSKSGFIYSNTGFDGHVFTASLRFRVSGQGKTLFGDGFTIIFSSQPSFRSGKYFGTSGMFKGVAVTFDTFKNTERANFHKDISIVVNDGGRDITELNREVPGCDSYYRWCESRDDFNIHNHAEARFSYNSETKKFKVIIDAKGDGKFVDCAEAEVGLDKKWTDNIYVGISAATGQLADNHDILSFNVYNTDNINEIPDEEKKKLEEEKNEKESEFSSEVAKAGGDVNQMNPIEKALHEKINGLELQTEIKLGDLEHHLEHQLTAVNDELKQTITKIQKQGDTSEERIIQLEKKLKELLEQKVNSEVNQRLQAVEKVLQQEIDTEVNKNQGKWIWPFFFLFIGLVGLSFVFYRKYKYIMKTHLL